MAYRTANISCVVFALMAMMLEFGCEHSTPNNKTPATNSIRSEPIVTVTPQCAAELRKSLNGLHDKTLYITVKAAENCVGYEYDVLIRKSPPTGNVIVNSSQGISIAIDSEVADFLKGSKLDYLPDPGGIKLILPHADVSLLPENRQKREEEARMRPVEEAQSNGIDPRKVVADLLTPRRQAAFEDLQLWWKFHQPEASDSLHSTVGRVDRYKLTNGESITVVFTGKPEQEKGGVHLIREDGRQIRIFHGNNYIGEDSQFIDVNGDGLPEMVQAATMGGHDKSDPNKVASDATAIDILPISPEQVPLLRIVFDLRPFSTSPTWRWKLVANATGAKDFVVEQQVAAKWTERARFVWSKAKGKFEGPSGSEEEGFIANAGDIEVNKVRHFLKE